MAAAVAPLHGTPVGNHCPRAYREIRAKLSVQNKNSKKCATLKYNFWMKIDKIWKLSEALPKSTSYSNSSIASSRDSSVASPNTGSAQFFVSPQSANKNFPNLYEKLLWQHQYDEASQKDVTLGRYELKWCWKKVIKKTCCHLLFWNTFSEVRCIFEVITLVA